jgi:hypothetical protein
MKTIKSPMLEGEAACQYCGAIVPKAELASHARKNKECLSIQRAALLLSEGLIPCHDESPIYKWAAHFHKGDPIWVYFDIDARSKPWIPLWFAELWFRANKSPVTGRLDCNYQYFLCTIHETVKSQRRQGILEMQAKMRGIGYFDQAGSILKADFTTPVWTIRSAIIPPCGTEEDFTRAAGGMLEQEQPFQIQPRYRRSNT